MHIIFLFVIGLFVWSIYRSVGEKGFVKLVLTLAGAGLIISILSIVALSIYVDKENQEAAAARAASAVASIDSPSSSAPPPPWLDQSGNDPNPRFFEIRKKYLEYVVDHDGLTYTDWEKKYNWKWVKSDRFDPGHTECIICDSDTSYIQLERKYQEYLKKKKMMSESEFSENYKKEHPLN